MVQLRDPLGLSDVVGDLRLLVFADGSRSCDSATGALTPALSDAADLVEDAVVDIRFAPGEAASVDLAQGTYTVHVRGRGTDPVSGRSDVIVARGCVGRVEIDGGQTREITIDIRDVVGAGVCMDGIVSQDEQCDGANGPQPCASCRTEAFTVNTTTENMQDAPHAAWAPNTRLAVSFVSRAATFEEVRFALRSELGDSITSPAALAVDVAADLDATVPGAQQMPTIAISPVRTAVAFQDIGNAGTEGGDVLMRVFDASRNTVGAPFSLAPAAGAQSNPQIAMLDDGTAMVVFEDQGGLSARIVLANSTTPSGATPFSIGPQGAGAPSIANYGDGFVVAFQSSGVAVQRFTSAGAPMDAEPRVVADAGSDPQIAAIANGNFAVTFLDGESIFLRAYDASAMPISEAQALNTTAGVTARPTIAATETHYLAAWEQGGSIRARVVDLNGNPARNREVPPTGDDFVLGAGSTPSAAATTDRAIVVWTAEGDIQGRLLPLP